MTYPHITKNNITEIIEKFKENKILEENDINNEYEDSDEDIENFLPAYSIPKPKISPRTSRRNINIPYIAEKNIPLFIKDILQLQLRITDERNITVSRKTHFSAYGIPFETVTVYGNWFQKSVDDGTGSIQVTHCNKKYISIINNLRVQLDNRIQSATDLNEIELNSCLNRILEKTEAETTKKKLKNGVKVSVIGKPIKFKDSTICLRAFEIKVDNDQNRGKEIFFKRELVRYYTTYYKDYQIDGSKKK